MVDSATATSLKGACIYQHSLIKCVLYPKLVSQLVHDKFVYVSLKLCGPAVYFVLTHGDLQRREWTFCCSVMKRVEKYSLGGSIGEEIHV